jgi:hypothetical protein
MARGTAIPAFEAVQYGVLSDKDSHLTRGGNRVTRYQYRDRSVWAFSTLGVCPITGGLGLATATSSPPHPCIAWRFLDASTGQVLAQPIQDVKSPAS